MVDILLKSKKENDWKVTIEIFGQSLLVELMYKHYYSKLFLLFSLLFSASTNYTGETFKKMFLIFVYDSSKEVKKKTYFSRLIATK